MSSQNIILSIHYHKTGRKLSLKIYKIFEKYINDCIQIKDPVKKRIIKWDSNNCIKFTKIKFVKKKKHIKYIIKQHQIFLKIYFLKCLKLIKLFI